MSWALNAICICLGFQFCFPAWLWGIIVQHICYWSRNAVRLRGTALCCSPLCGVLDLGAAHSNVFIPTRWEAEISLSTSPRKSAWFTMQCVCWHGQEWKWWARWVEGWLTPGQSMPRAKCLLEKWVGAWPPSLCATVMGEHQQSLGSDPPLPASWDGCYESSSESLGCSRRRGDIAWDAIHRSAPATSTSLLQIPTVHWAREIWFWHISYLLYDWSTAIIFNKLSVRQHSTHNSRISWRLLRL